MRLIDADALRDRLQNLGYDDWNQGVTTTWAEAFKECADMVEEMPTIEPEIVRCKDCLHAIEDGLCGGYWCKGKPVTSNHYCGYAERRDND